MSTESQVASLLDRVDPMRFNVDKVVRKLNAFDDLPEDEYDGSMLPYADVNEAMDPLTTLCGEAHNTFFAVRDLDGSMQFIFETGPRIDTARLPPEHAQDLLPTAALAVVKQ